MSAPRTDVQDTHFERTLEMIQQRTKKPIFETWFRNLELIEVQEDIIRIGTPNQFVKKWIEESEQIHTLAEAIQQSYQRSLTPELLITKREGAPVPSEPFPRLNERAFLKRVQRNIRIARVVVPALLLVVLAVAAWLVAS